MDKKMNVIKSSDYKKFFMEIKARIVQARHEAYRVANKAQVMLYWDIGKGIVEKQERLGWGEAVVEKLAVDLQREFGGIKGFSKENLWRMKKLYETYRETPKLSTLLAELSSVEQSSYFKQGAFSPGKRILSKDFN